MRKPKKIFWVDIPDSNKLDNGEWVNVGLFGTRKEALEFCKKQFNADKKGKISLISQGEG